MSMSKATASIGQRLGSIRQRPRIIFHQKSRQWKNNYTNSHAWVSPTASFGSFPAHDRQWEERPQPLHNMPLSRSFHSSDPDERAVAIMLGLGAVSAGSYAAATGLRAYREWEATQPTIEEVQGAEEEEAKRKAQEESAKPGKKQQADGPSVETEQGPRENIFAKWFGVGVGAKYYEGGFEEAMTRREAALILGVRESSSSSRIKDAHRKLLILNHPDTGGSTYMAGKINEAKELLLKGKRD